MKERNSLLWYLGFTAIALLLAWLAVANVRPIVAEALEAAAVMACVLVAAFYSALAFGVVWLASRPIGAMAPASASDRVRMAPVAAALLAGLAGFFAAMSVSADLREEERIGIMLDVTGD